MDLTTTKLDLIQTPIPPFINELVEALHTDAINEIIESENVQVDKKTFLMFIITFFITRLFCEKNSNPLNKDEIKVFNSAFID
jgi:hypothetical protein